MRYPDPVSLMTYHRGFPFAVRPDRPALLAWLIRRYWPQALMGQAAVPDALAGFGDTSFAGRLHRLWHPAVLAAGAGAGKLGGRVHHRPGLYGAAAGGVAACGRRGHDGARARIAGDGAGIQHGLSGFRSGGQGGGRTPRARCMVAQGIEVTALRAVPMPFTLVWRVLAKTPDAHYYEAVSGWFDRTSPEWLRLPLNPDAGANLTGSALHDRLRWFTGDWLRHDVIGDALVTDLRMGVAGTTPSVSRWPSARREAIGSRSCPAAGPAPAGWPELNWYWRAFWMRSRRYRCEIGRTRLCAGSCPCRPRTAAWPAPHRRRQARGHAMAPHPASRSCLPLCKGKGTRIFTSCISFSFKRPEMCPLAKYPNPIRVLQTGCIRIRERHQDSGFPVLRRWQGLDALRRAGFISSINKERQR